jgi:SAM-dependent methyltransferase
MVERAVPGEPEWAELSAPHLARYLFAADYARGHRVLDAGTGSGYGAVLLRACGAAAVDAVDIDATTIEQARRRFGDAGVHFYVDDCERLEQAVGPFDLICCFENLEHLQYPDRFLAAAARVLVPTGVLLISTPDRAVTPPFVDGRPKNPFHVHEWYWEELRGLLAVHFREIELRLQIQTIALERRIEAVTALRQRLLWGNPLLTLLWRHLPFLFSRRGQPWKQLAGLAAPTIADYPILPAATAALFGTPWFHVAICRQPKP